MNALVIPSCRQEQLTAFFQAWAGIGGWDCVYLVDDSEGQSLDFSASDKPVQRFGYAEIAADLGDRSWIISRKDSGCRCYGIYRAWRDGAEYILTLDDDVRPHHRCENIMGQHIERIAKRGKFQSSVVGLSPRGMPDCQEFRTDVKASMGLWAGVPDLYAADMLNGYPTDYKPPLGTRLIPHGEFIPVCGMNLCVHRDAAPLAYFPLQGEGQKYHRFDDIWMGLLLKTALDKIGWYLSVGEPFIRHERASDPVKCAEREASGRGAMNDTIWKMVSKGHVIPSPDDGYIESLGRAFQTWSELFK